MTGDRGEHLALSAGLRLVDPRVVCCIRVVKVRQDGRPASSGAEAQHVSEPAHDRVSQRARGEVRWWGVALPRAGQLIVADPRLPSAQVLAVLSDVRDGARVRRAWSRYVGPMAGVAGALLVGVALATASDRTRAAALVLVALVFLYWACRTSSQLRALNARGRDRLVFAVRAAGNEQTWELVEHMENVAGHGASHRSSVRDLLWHVVHLSPHDDGAIAALLDQARSGQLRSGGDLREAIFSLRTRAQLSSQSPRCSGAQLAPLFRYEARE